MGELRKRRLKFLGIYHSHPYWLDTNEPSPKDIALACYSEAIHFIVTPRLYATTPVRVGHRIGCSPRRIREKPMFLTD